MVSALMTEEEAAEYLKLSPRTLRNWRSSDPDRLPARKQGRIIRYDREIVQAFFSETKKPGVGAPGHNKSKGNQIV